MSIGTPDGLMPAYSDHEPARKPGLAQKRPSAKAADDRAAYDLAARRDGASGDEKREGTCQRCQRFGTVQMDHRQNRQAGNTVPSNLQALCPTCHAWKTEHPDDAVAEGWAVLRHTTLTPAEWPARRWMESRFGTMHLGWVLYFDAPEHGRMWLEIADIEAHYRRKAAGVL